MTGYLSSLLRTVRSWFAPSETPHDTEEATGEITRAEIEPPEQYVERLLTAADGRLSQQAIVEATDWSSSSVSRHLSSMESQGQVVRVPIGREKIVCLPYAAPERTRNADTTEMAHS